MNAHKGTERWGSKKKPVSRSKRQREGANSGGMGKGGVESMEKDLNACQKNWGEGDLPRKG